MLRTLLADGTVSADTGRLARRLIDAGMAHPEAPGRRADLIGPAPTVVVPVHNRAATLERCLASLGPDADVVVVDDASDDPAAVAAVCRRHGARLIRRDVNGGPAAARNQAMAVVDSPLVAFVDSDCTVGDGWPGRLVAMFDDPAVGAVAPRVRPEGHDPGGSDRPSLLARFSQSHSSLDMGPEPSGVGPGCRVRYVPTAAIVMRTTALEASTGLFDTELRVGEDVDLVWRLVDAGWSVRYQPSVTVSHREPRTWGALWARRFSYGTSAGPLARRHRGRLAPVELRPWPAAAALAMVSGRYLSAAVMTAGGGALLALRLRGHAHPAGHHRTLGRGHRRLDHGRDRTSGHHPGRTHSDRRPPPQRTGPCRCRPPSGRPTVGCVGPAAARHRPAPLAAGLHRRRRLLRSRGVGRLRAFPLARTLCPPHPCLKDVGGGGLNQKERRTATSAPYGGTLERPAPTRSAGQPAPLGHRLMGRTVAEYFYGT